MRKLVLIAIIILMIGCVKSNKTEHHITNSSLEKEKESIRMDSIKVSKSMAIIKGRLIKIGVGNKYMHSKIVVLEVLVNSTNFHFKDTMDVSYYNWKQGIPLNKECVIYLTSWPYGSKKLNEKGEWMLIDGDGKYACNCYH
ncbi:MAG: hypothetical protein ACPGTO_03120 [Polaribacter sp.]